MSSDQNHSLRFPIGEFQKPAEYSAAFLQQCIDDIKSFPERIKKETNPLTKEQLDTPYRPDGWTVRQVVHHCADSHMNSLTRFKLALTEDKPVIKPYWEDRWAELPDGKMDIAPALLMLEGLHQRWIVLLNSLKDDDFKKVFIHPEHGREISLAENTAFYGWHCNHHLAHVRLVSGK